MVKNSDTDKYKYSGYSIAFESLGSFSLFKSSGFGKNVIIVGADMTDMSSSVLFDKMVLGKVHGIR